MKRIDVNVKETWDLSQIFETEFEYNSSLEMFKDLVDVFVDNYKDKIDNLETVNNSILDFIEISELISVLGAYATLPLEADYSDEKAKDRRAEFYSIIYPYYAKLSFYQNELLQLNQEILEEASKNPENKVFIEDILEFKSHSLDTNVEEILSQLSETMNLPYTIYNTSKLQDMSFDNFEADGKTYKLSYNLYEDGYDSSPNTEIRRNSFKEFSKILRNYQNTTAAAYNAQVQKEKTLSNIRKYDSVFEYLLKSQKVDRSLYDRQIDVIMNELAPHMRRYAKLLKRIHKLDTMKYSDLKMEVDPDYSPKVTYEQAKEYILDGLSILGEDYQEILVDAFENRWIDYANNEEKSTGAFCSSPYGTNSFILMTFNNSMSDVMTLAHELGHAGHFQLAHENQNILNSDSSMYFVEAPSTCNELILENYLLDKAEEKNDLRMKRWILSQMISKTYYHNFVTHLLEAHYQREVYEIVDKGGHVYADTLNSLYKSTLEKFWGDAVDLEEGCELTWMRQPHYYMGLYPYTYSAGLTIGTQVAKKIRENGIEEAEDWKKVLKMGGTKTPQELANAAGVNVSTDKPLKDTISYIGSIIDEIEEISKVLGDI